MEKKVVGEIENRSKSGSFLLDLIYKHISFPDLAYMIGMKMEREKIEYWEGTAMDLHGDGPTCTITAKLE